LTISSEFPRKRQDVLKRLLLLTLPIVILILSMISGTPRASSAAQSTWSGSITISGDGTVNPVDAPIQRVGNQYRLTGDIQGNIDVYANNIVIDGSGHMIQGDGYGTGINTENFEGISLSFTVKNTRFSNLQYGIFFVNTDNCTITGNSFRNCSIGICLGFPDWHYGGGTRHIVTNNTISSCGVGIFTQSQGITVSSNVIVNNTIGVGSIMDDGGQFLDNLIVNNTKAAIDLSG
jgi:hypothetical protein